MQPCFPSTLLIAGLMAKMQDKKDPTVPNESTAAINTIPSAESKHGVTLKAKDVEPEGKPNTCLSTL